MNRPFLSPAVALAALLAACAPQPSATAVAPAAASLAAPGNGRADAAAPMAGMDHSGMDMNAMMSHCAIMRRQARPGAAMTADMRTMMAQCDEMDRSMGMPAPRRR